LATFRLDYLFDPDSRVCLEVVHDHNLPCVEAGSQDLFDIQFKSGRVGRSFQNQRGSHTFKREGGDQRRILSAIARYLSSGPFPLRRPSIQGRQSNIRAALINEDQRFCWELARILTPGGSFLLIAFRRSDRLFFRVQPNRLIARLMVQRLTRSP